MLTLCMHAAQDERDGPGAEDSCARRMSWLDLGRSVDASGMLRPQPVENQQPLEVVQCEHGAVPVDVAPYSDRWPELFDSLAHDLGRALEHVPIVSIEHVGSTAVPGLPAKPILDIDIVVERAHLVAAISALADAGYVHCGDLGVTDREALDAPDASPPRNVYVCIEGTLHARNHLAVRDVLRRRPDLRDRYGAVKSALAREPDMDIETYIAGKSEILQEVLALSDLSDEERAQILALNA